MTKTQAHWETPATYIASASPTSPLLFKSPGIARKTAESFVTTFDGQTTYAVKACPDLELIAALWTGGVKAFDVASPSEIDLVRRLLPSARLHYDNPVKSDAEIHHAHQCGVAGYAIDSAEELEALARIVPASGVTVFVRFKADIDGGVMSLSSKFGATAPIAADLLTKVAALGYAPALTFHPGIDCKTPEPYLGYIRQAIRIAVMAGVNPTAINIGGGFPGDVTNDAKAYLSPINQAMAAFGPVRPLLIAEPGRALAAPAMRSAAQIKRFRGADNAAFLNDGVYGLLAETIQLNRTPEFDVISSQGQIRVAPRRPVRLFGPTCDSIDELPGPLSLPTDAQVGDWLVFHQMGAYSLAMSTSFNGYGQHIAVCVEAFSKTNRRAA